MKFFTFFLACKLVEVGGRGFPGYIHSMTTKIFYPSQHETDWQQVEAQRFEKVGQWVIYSNAIPSLTHPSYFLMIVKNLKIKKLIFLLSK